MFDTHRIAISWIALIALLALPISLWLSAHPNVIEYLGDDVPHGQFAYVMSKLVGLMALVLLWLHVVYTLLRRTTLINTLFPVWRLGIHRILGILLFGAALTHFALFFVAVTLRTDSLATHLLLRSFSGYYNQALSVGWFVIVFMVAVVSAGLLRKRLGKRWKLVHNLSLPVLIGALAHSYLIGSETNQTSLLILYGIMAIALCVSLILRCLSGGPASANQPEMQ